jgi:hypothetical protein
MKIALGADGDYSDYEHPMHRLAESLGSEVVYPAPASDTWVRIVLTIAPCSLLVLVSIPWPIGAPFLLTFAGAFASIQLVEPYRRWGALLSDHLIEAREQRQTAIAWARVKYAFRTSPKFYEGTRAVGYSPAARARARRRFPRLARRWHRNFLDISGRVIWEPGSRPEAAARLSLLYRQHSFDYDRFVRAGRTRPTRIVRSLVGLLRLLFATMANRFDRSSTVVRFRSWRAERVLERVGVELIRATSEIGGDRTVRALADQVGLRYRTPDVKDAWVFRVAISEPIQREPSRFQP